MNDFSLRLERSFASTESLQPEWDRLVAELGGSVYMSYDWCKTWWTFYGEGRELRIFLFTQADRLLGLLPIYIDQLGPRPFQLRIARLVGSNIPPKVFDPPIPEPWAQPMWRETLTHLFSQDRCDLFSLGPVSELHPGTKFFHQGNRNYFTETGLTITAAPPTVHTVFWLPNSLDEFYAGLPRSERKKRQYEVRLLKKETAASEDVVCEPDRLTQEFEDFTRLHAQQWQAKGKLGHFRSWPQGEAYNRALVRALGKLGRVRFMRIRADNQLISSQYVFSFGHRYYWELPARAIGAHWQRYSLGPAGFLAMVDQAIREGITRVDAGLAQYDYKRKLNGKEYRAWTYRLVAGSTASKLKVWCFNLLRHCLLWGYYKLWYSRISPRLPECFRKPIWTVWLRLDF